ncbi:MAG: recombinase family protein [Clostridia bacterium]|nr:recombinase family protein [Clostridia bacterium]
MWQTGACYIRVSTDDQTEYSPEAQLKAIKSYAQKNNITLTKQFIFIDEGISGKKAEKRPAFMQMIGLAKSKPRPFDVILVHKFDRFARSREDSVVYKSLLKKEAGIKVVSITESIEDDKFSIILEAMLEAMAEYYSLNLAEEVKKGMTEKATRGGLQTGSPFGYKVVNNVLEIVPEEAEFVKFIFQKFANKEMNYLQLARYANEIGIHSHRGCQFENRTIEYILRNPVYIGKLRWNPTGKTNRDFDNPNIIVEDGKHQPIIDLALWEQAQIAVRESRELHHRKTHSTTNIKNWSYGLIKCGNCGKSLVMGAIGSYQCCGYARGMCSVSHSIKIQKAENLILEQLKKDFSEKLEIKVLPKESDTDNTNEYTLLNERLEKCKIKEQRIREAYQDGIDTKEEYRENKANLEKEKETLLSQLAELDNNLKHPKECDRNIYTRIETAYTLLTDETVPIDVKYQTAHFLIHKITYKKPEQILYLEYK